MARAKRLNAGDAFISAGNLNKVVEQANRLDAFQGGPGVNSQNDATGLQLSGRKRITFDGDSPFSSSSPWRRTLKKGTGTTGTTRHRNEPELYNSSNVSSRAVTPSSSRPERYGVPMLPVSSSGSGALVWPTMDADEFGTSGPRSIERRSSSGGERFQMYGFDAAAITLDSSEVTQTPVRRRYGSSGNHYIAWVNSSDLEGGATVPRWDEVLDANTSVDFVSDTTSTLTVGDSLNIGTQARLWNDIEIANRAQLNIRSGDQGTEATSKNTIIAMGETSLAESYMRLSVYNGDLKLNTFHSGDIEINTAGDLFITGLAGSAGAAGLVYVSSSGYLKLS